MATDAKFDKIQKIIPHESADALEIALVSNFPCVVRKGEFKEGDWVLYIRDDSKLLGYDEYKARLERDKEAAKTGDFVTQDGFTCTWQWQDGLLKYLGGGGRVKSIRLRGKVSMGILLKPNEVIPTLNRNFYDELCPEYNRKIQDPDTGAAYLEKMFGIVHWEPPTTGFGSLNVKSVNLPAGLSITDENNWENLDEPDLHLGSKCLLTKKLDGTSTTITCYPDGKYEVSSRRMTFNIEDMLAKNEDNIYTKFSKDAVKAGLWYAKTFNKVIAVRGETCCNSIQNSSYNKDRLLEGFFVFRCEFPEEENYHLKYGTYGTKNHFTEVVKLMNENGFNVKTVPVLGEETVTKELLSKYNDMTWEWGEGVVLNIKVEDENAPLDSFVWDYKSKSREYLMKMK